MAIPQSGILPDGNTHAVFITLNIQNGEAGLAHARQVLAQVPELTQNLAQQYPDAHLSSVVSIGAGMWDSLSGMAAPQQLAPFKAREFGHRKMPATPADVLLHIRSERRDINFELSRHILAQAGDVFRVVEEISGFRYLDARDMTGFVDGTENPEGDERADVALIDDSDPAGAGGSYVMAQRYIHDLANWGKLGKSHQEAVIGRTKDTDEELDDDIKPESAHISRVVVKEDGEELEILRHSMPYGDSEEAGLLFIAYSAEREIFDIMLDRMMNVAGDGVHDHLMDYTRAVTGAFFYAPTQEQLATLSKAAA